jgi:putative hydrolase of the HAD superfamily
MVHNQSNPIRAVTFDLDDTLWDIWPVIERAEARLHAWLHAQYPAISAQFSALELRELANEIAVQRQDMAHDRTLIRKEALRLAADRVGCEDFCPESAFDIFLAARHEVVFFADVLPVLEGLAGRYRLGALTNGNADIQRLGLSHLFEFAISAVEVGAAKPEPPIYQAACRLLELSPEQIVHVGDDPQNDVLGAAQVGLRTVWINRDGRAWPGGQCADAEIKTLEELEPILMGWQTD